MHENLLSSRENSVDSGVEIYLCRAKPQNLESNFNRKNEKSRDQMKPLLVFWYAN